MRAFFTLILFIGCLTGKSFAQLSKLQFQDAEQAYSEGKFEEAIQFLNEAERSLGKANPPIMHMRILSRAEVIKKNPDKDFEIIDHFRKETNLFLKEYSDDTRLEDKYREVYAASKLLKNLPLSKRQFEEEVKNRKEAMIKAEQVRKEKLQRFLSFTYAKDFQKGVPLQTIIDTWPRIVRNRRTREVNIDRGYRTVYHYINGYEVYFENDRAIGYRDQEKFENNSSLKEGKELLAERKAYFTDLFGFEPVEDKGSYTWASGQKTFILEYNFDSSSKFNLSISYIDIDKS